MIIKKFTIIVLGMMMLTGFTLPVSAITQKLLNDSFESGSGNNASSWSGDEDRDYGSSDAYSGDYYMDLNQNDAIYQTVSIDTDETLYFYVYHRTGDIKVTFDYLSNPDQDWSSTNEPGNWTQFYISLTSIEGGDTLIKITITALDETVWVDLARIYIDGGCSPFC